MSVVATPTVRPRSAGGGDRRAGRGRGRERRASTPKLLLAEASGRERAALVADPGAELPPAAARLFGELVRRRLRREPVAYILGRKGFRQIELAVDRRVLIPRPETELLVELALELRPGARCSTSAPAPARSPWRSPTSCRTARSTATDTSPGALEVARANAERLGLADRVRFDDGHACPAGGDASTSSSPTFPTSPSATGPRCSPR